MHDYPSFFPQTPTVINPGAMRSYRRQLKRVLRYKHSSMTRMTLRYGETSI